MHGLPPGLTAYKTDEISVSTRLAPLVHEVRWTVHMPVGTEVLSDRIRGRTRSGVGGR